MRCRSVWEVAERPDRWLVSDWLDNDRSLNQDDKDFVEQRLNRFEIDEDSVENRRWIKPYTSLRMWELLFDTGGKAIRILCHRDRHDIVMLVGCVKKGKIPNTVENKARELRDKWKKGELSVREYPNPYHL